jgi:CRP-like cAMP-binding protein
MFAPEGWLVGDFEPQTNDAPTVLSIDALEDAEIEAIDTENFGIFDDMPPEVLQQQIKKLVRRISVLQHRILMLMSATAAARYEEFIKTYPNVSQRVPQRMIASYLGVTPEALSKIRGEIAKK